MKRLAGQRLDAATRERLAELLRAGTPAMHAAQAVGCDVSTAARTARRLGVALRRGRPMRADITRERARAAVAEHGSIHAAALALGCRWHVIARRLEAA